MISHRGCLVLGFPLEQVDAAPLIPSPEKGTSYHGPPFRGAHSPLMEQRLTSWKGGLVEDGLLRCLSPRFRLSVVLPL